MGEMGRFISRANYFIMLLLAKKIVVMITFFIFKQKENTKFRFFLLMHRFCASQRVILVIFISLHKKLLFKKENIDSGLKKSPTFLLFSQALPLKKISFLTNSTEILCLI